MLISIPQYRGKSRSREYDLGSFGFPYLAIANIIVNGAYGGWSYYMTKQQIEQAKRISGTDIASAADIQSTADKVLAQLGIKDYATKSEVSDYISKLVSGAPMETQQLPPSVLLEARMTALEQQQQQPKPGIPTWGWVALGAVGFLALKQFGVLKSM